MIGLVFSENLQTKPFLNNGEGLKTVLSERRLKYRSKRLHFYAPDVIFCSRKAIVSFHYYIIHVIISKK